MQLNDGICTFYRPDDGRGSGNFPGKTAKVLYSAWYGERTVGFSRFFTAQQANTRGRTPHGVCELKFSLRFVIMIISQWLHYVNDLSP